MRKATRILFALLASATVFVLSGCSDFKTSPEITGVADDGLYLYSGNKRYTSDYENGEDLISSVNIDGVTQNFIKVAGAHYVGDDAYLGATYYENDAYNSVAGSCIVKYNVAYKTKELIFNYVYDSRFNERYIVADILWVSGDGRKIAVLSDYGNTLLIYDGGVVDELPDGVAYAFDDDFYAFADNCYITCKSWDGAEMNEFESVYRIESLEIYEEILYARTSYTYRGEQWRNEDWEYDCNGLEGYDPFSGERLLMSDPSVHKTIYTDLQAGYSIRGQMSGQMIDGEICVFATNFELYLIKDNVFHYFCDFDNAAVDWIYNTPEVRGDYIIFGGCGEESGKFVTDMK